jgi:hypothetical protein
MQASIDKTFAGLNSKPRMTTAVNFLSQSNGLIVPSMKLEAPRKTMTDLSVIKEELSKLTLKTSQDDQQALFKTLVRA